MLIIIPNRQFVQRLEMHVHLAWLGGCHLQRRLFSLILLSSLVWPALLDARDLKPGWNLFSKEQDVQLGKEAAAQVRQQMPIVKDAGINDYIRKIGRRLASQPQAGDFPYSFEVVADESINAFALPGGPAFVHTGLILAAENEAQLAGVLAHEIAHVALRHGTNQVSKANAVQIPAMILSGVLGRGGSMMDQLTQLGIGIGANSVMMKFSRSAERDADLLGTRIMSSAGYNPIEMARFFEKLEAEGGSRGPEFLSSHPNPGNRVKAVQAEIQTLPRRQHTTDTGDLTRIQSSVSKIRVKPARTTPAGSTPSRSRQRSR